MGSDEDEDIEQFVNLQWSIYHKNLKIAEDFPNASEEAIIAGKRVAREKLLNNLEESNDPERALQIVSQRFDDEKHMSYQDLVIRDEKRKEARQKDSINFGKEKKIPLRLLKLFDIDKNGKTFFDKEVLDSLCEQIGDRSLAVISTAGKFRQGKTFWNNVLLKGLQDGEAHFKSGDYIGGEDQIQFQAGFDRHTKGIMVWPKVFDRVDKNGRKLAVILMDTQGTFDTSSNMGDSAIIFAISLLMSSTKIFNSKNQLDAQDLDALNSFIAFSQRNDEKAGQNFIVMVRDSIRKGKDNDYLQEMRNNAKGVPELSRLVDGFFEAFERIDCFQIPRPNAEVIHASDRILADDCGKDFLDALCDCANFVLNNLTAKTVLGTPLTGRTLGAYVEQLVDHIQANSKKAICCAFAATSQLYFEKAKSAGSEMFVNLHDQLIRHYQHRPIRPREYEPLIREILNESIKVYQSCPFFGSSDEKRREIMAFTKDRCQEKISNNRDRYRDVQMADAVNGAYAGYEKDMKPDLLQSLSKTQKAGVVKENHERAFPEAMAYFDRSVEDFADEPEIIEHKRKLLCDMIQTRYSDLLQDNAIHHMHQKMEVMFNDLLEIHWTNLKKFVDMAKSIDEIGEFTERSQYLLKDEYQIRKAEFLNEMKELLPKVSSQMIGEMMDNYRDSISVHFKKCEDSFENEVRHQLKVQALNDQMGKLHEKQAEDKKILEDLKNETSSQINGLNERLIEEAQKREEAEANGTNMQAMMEMMKQMNENSQSQIEKRADESRQMEQMHTDSLSRIEEEAKRIEDQKRREQELITLMTEDRKRFEERIAELDRQRAEDIRAQQEAIQRMAQQQVHPPQIVHQNRPPKINLFDLIPTQIQGTVKIVETAFSGIKAIGNLFKGIF